MLRISFWLCCLLGVVTPALGQVTVEVLQEQDQFLPGEALPTAVRITNHSGQILHLGTDDDWLTFLVESKDRTIVPKSGDVPVRGEIILPSNKVLTKRFDLAPYFSVSLPGPYSITATLRIPGWNNEFTSRPKKFDVIEGAKLWEQEVGIPEASGAASGNPELRKYILQQAHYLKSQLRLYLRLTDGSGAKVFKVFPVGPMVSFARPEPQVDRDSNLHLLYQDKPRSFDYTVFNPNGEIVRHQTYDYINTRPRLQPDGDGRVSVVGGTRRVTAKDVPEPTPEELLGEKPATPVMPPIEAKPGKP
jgi:hypothetical protein